MGRSDSPPFARGETYANGNAEILNAANEFWGLGGVNLEGKEFVFEPNSQDDFTGGTYASPNFDPNGRPIRVKVVRNVSGQNLKPKRLARYQLGTARVNLETRVDGYTTGVGDVPAGMVDEFLPAAGVPNNDLFYLVIDGPTVGTSPGAGTVAINHGDYLVPGTGTSATNDNAGRVASQDLTGTGAAFANNILNKIGRSDAIVEVTTTGANVPVVMDLAD